ncbi:MAG: hypothetical protein HY319_04105 [Armatimonadetes bacterium]|nr:hypothetical protein [Armatimonadota bacterium]
MRNPALPEIYRWWVPAGLAVILVTIYSRIPGLHDMSVLEMTSLLAVWTAMPLALRLLSEEEGEPRRSWVVFVYSGGAVFLWFSTQMLEEGTGALAVALLGTAAVTAVALRYALVLPRLAPPAWLGGMRLSALGYLVIGTGLLASARHRGQLWTLTDNDQLYLGTVFCVVSAVLLGLSLDAPHQGDLRARRRRLALVPAATLLSAPVGLLASALIRPEFPVGNALHVAGLVSCGLLLIARAGDEGPALWKESSWLAAVGAFGVAGATLLTGGTAEASVWPLTLEILVFCLPLLTGLLYRAREEVFPETVSHDTFRDDLDVRYANWRSWLGPVRRLFSRQA